MTFNLIVLDIDLSLTDNTLTIRGSLEQERTTEPPASSEQQGESKQPSYWSSERIYGSFSRSFAFPTAVDAEGVKARLENGVLKVEVPKRAQEEGGKKITVEEIQA